MPPTVKVDNQAILQAALDVTKEKGSDALTARNIAQKLHCSTQPIFRVYENMAALKKDLFEYANQFFARYIMMPSDGGDPFFNIGFRYIQFAKDEANIFKMMFMSGCVESDNLIELFTSDKDNIKIMKAIPNFANCTNEQIKDLFVKIAICTHGIASLVATNDIEFDSTAISKLLTELFHALVNDINSKGTQP